MNLLRPLPLLIATIALLAGSAARADAPAMPAGGDPLADYVRARAADDLGQLDVAARGFASAAALDPGDASLSLRAFRQAVAAGDFALAVKTAQALDARQSLPPDGTLLLVADAIQRRDWKRATALLPRIETEKLFAFTAPVLRAWIAYGSHRGDPLSFLDNLPAGSLAATYAQEQRALLLLVTGKVTAGVAAIGAMQLPQGARAERLRIAAAAILQRKHKDDAARAMLAGDGPAVAVALARLNAGKAIPGAIDTPAEGVAELYVRIAADINQQQAAPLALGFARMATMLAPDASEGWIVCSGLLSLAGADEAALAAIDHVASDDPFAAAARDMRLTLLVRAGRKDEALAQAQQATRQPGATASDWSRYGDLLMGADRAADAAAAYGRALALAGGDRAPPGTAWPLLLQQANASLVAGDWPSAKALAQRALALAPDRPEVLNFLGYSELDHGGDPAAAAALIAKASAMAPDDPSITDSLGWSWYLRGRLDRAIPLLERAAQGAPAESDINEHLGDAYWKADRRLAARYAWRAALVAADGDQATRLKNKILYGIAGKP